MILVSYFRLRKKLSLLQRFRIIVTSTSKSLKEFTVIARNWQSIKNLSFFKCRRKLIIKWIVLRECKGGSMIVNGTFSSKFIRGKDSQFSFSNAKKLRESLKEIPRRESQQIFSSRDSKMIFKIDKPQLFRGNQVFSRKFNNHQRTRQWTPVTNMNSYKWKMSTTYDQSRVPATFSMQYARRRHRRPICVAFVY